MALIIKEPKLASQLSKKCEEAKGKTLRFLAAHLVWSVITWDGKQREKEKKLSYLLGSALLLQSKQSIK